MTQSEKILGHMKGGAAITPVQALNLYGCFRLAARIHDLRAVGWDIEVETLPMAGTNVAMYKLSDAALKKILQKHSGLEAGQNE